MYFCFIYRFVSYTVYLSTYIYLILYQLNVSVISVLQSAVTDTLYERDVANAPLTAARTHSPEPRMPSMNLTPRDQQ